MTLGRIRRESGKVFLTASIIVFIIYFANVALGAFAGSAFLEDVGEMLVLFAASILFVVAILKKEADRDAESDG
nr:hypothetical protein [Ruegeria sp. HKCCD7239]